MDFLVSIITLSYILLIQGEVQALFLRHEGYLGAIGAFLKGAKECAADDYSWKENLYGSSAFSRSPGNVSVQHCKEVLNRM